MDHRRRLVTSLLVLGMATLPCLAAAQQARAAGTDAGGAASDPKWSMPRTPWGHPDLQGVWSTATITPFERAADMANKPFLAPEEVADFERQTVERTNRDRRDGGAEADVARAYNDFWWDSGTRVVPTRRTSLVIDPPDGRVPALTPEAQKRVDDLAAARKTRGLADYPEDRNLWERCLTRGVPNVMLPQVYNNNYQVYQTPDYVVVVAEMIHDARIIPLNGRPHLSRSVRQWMGDPVGRWEGDTLVVETTHFTHKTSYRGAGEHLRLVERFTRTAPDVLTYQVTVEDPTTFSRPWTAELPARRGDGEMYEYACHEGNYGLEGILRGARAIDKK
ncbi:MAG: hypothetical protein ACT4QD_18595 [Acidobacteriota bacterium]